MNEIVIELLNILKFPKEDIPYCIETGTHRGWGSESFATVFKKVYTIELSKELYEYCIDKYKNCYDNIKFMNGKSPEVIKSILNEIDDKYLLFLDAHGSGGDTTFDESVGRYGSPVLDEIRSCVNKPPEYIVIDDLADFHNIPSYPKVDMIIEEVRKIGNYTNNVINKYKGWLVFEKVKEL